MSTLANMLLIETIFPNLLSLKGKNMSKSYAALKPAIVSILVNHALAVRERVSQPDCHYEKSRNIDIDLPHSDYYGNSVSLIEALEYAVEQNKQGEIHSDYQSDMKNLETFLVKLKADQSRIEAANKENDVIRARVVAVMESKRDAAIEALVGKHVLYNVRVKTGKLSEEQVKAVNTLFAEKGFVGGVVQETNWSNFVGLAECSADDLYAEVVAAVPNTTKNFISKKVEVKAVDLIRDLDAEVRNVVGR